MELFKRDIWKLYYTIVLLSLIFFFVISYALWNQKISAYKDRQETYATSTAYYIENLFSQYETLLDIIGKNLLDKSMSFEQRRKVLDQVLVLNPTLAGVALFKPDGTPEVITSNIDIKKMPNLLKTKGTRQGFIEALHSKHMIIGRTYYLKPLDALVIPIRKAIYDKQGNIAGVISSDIALRKNAEFIHSLLRGNKTFLLREKDHYLQFYDFDKSFYTKPVGAEGLKQVLQSIEQLTKKTLREIKDSENIVSLDCRSYITAQESYSSYKYIKRYGEWIVVTTPLSIIKGEFFNQELVILGIYLLIMIII